MAYTLTKTDGSTLIVLNDGVTDDTVTDLTLIGKNFAGYGQFLNENFIYLLENFSNATSPAIPLQGQLWWNSSGKSLQVWTGIAWKGISSTAAQSTAPTNPNVGDLWWDTVNNQLKVLSTLPSTWTVIGPQYSTGLGLTGAIATTVTDLASVSHIVVEFVVNNTVVGIFSRDTPAYTISSPPNFSLIQPGLTLANDPTVGPNGYQFVGNVTNALSLGGSLASTYVRNDVPAGAQSMAVPLTINNTSGLTVGTSTDLNINTVGNVNFAGTVLNKSTNFSVNYGGVSKSELTLDATLGVATVPNISISSPGTSIVNKNYADNTGFNCVDNYTVGHIGEIVSTRTGTITGPITSGLSTLIAKFDAAAGYRSAEFLIQATTSSSYQLSKVLAIYGGGTAYATEFGSVNSGTVIATYTAITAGSQLQIYALPSSIAATTFKVTMVAVTS